MTHKKICVFCASSNNVSNIYLDSAYDLGEKLARSGREIIYGGGNIGLMGRLADGAIKEGGLVTGVIPQFLDSLELGHKGLSEMITVESMHQREYIMIRNSDAIVILPGGCGTFSEGLQAITWKHLGLIITPIIFVNINNFYDHLIKQLELTVEEKFRGQTHLQLWKKADNTEQVFKYLE